MEVYKSILELLKQKTFLYQLGDDGFFLALGVLVFFIVLAYILMFLFSRIFFHITQKTKTKTDDLILEVIRGPFIKSVILFGLIVSTLSLELQDIMELFLVRLVSSIIIVHLTFMSVKVLVILVNDFGKKWAAKTKSKVDDDLIPLFGKIATSLGVVIGFLLILTLWGFEVGPFLASLGIAGLAVGLALKDTLANIFGGMSLILDRTFKVGDFIKLDSGEVGLVHDIGLRATRIKTFSNELIIVPNGKLANSKIQNSVLPSSNIRVDAVFTAKHGTDIDKVTKVVMEVISTLEHALDDPAAIVPLEGIDDGGLRFGPKFWVAELGHRYSSKIKFHAELIKAFEKNKIEFAYPPHQLYMKK